MAQQIMDFLETEPIVKPYVVGRGILPVHGKMIIGGSPKSNKSWLVLNMMLDLARGKNLFSAEYKNGTPVFPVGKSWRVLYLEQELGEQGLLERLKGKDGQAGLVDRITQEELRELPMFIRPRDTAMRFDLDAGREFLIHEVEQVRPDVIFADPMAKFHLSNENDATEMGAVMRWLDHLIEDYKTTVVLVHHFAKDNFENPRRGGDKLRGSSAVYGDVDTVVEVVRRSNEHHTEPVLQLNFELRRGEPIEEIYVQRMKDGSIRYLEGYQMGAMQGGSNWPQRKRRQPHDDL